MTTFHACPDHSQRNAELLATYQRCRSATNRNAVIRANLPLVWRVARQEAKRSGHSFEDLTQEGCLGLIQAVERFDPSRGHTLSTAATPWIWGKQAMQQKLLPLSQPCGAIRSPSPRRQQLWLEMPWKWESPMAGTTGLSAVVTRCTPYPLAL